MTKELNPGTKYLSISIDVGEALKKAHKAIIDGEENLSIAVFKNEELKTDNSPNYKGKGCAVWINTKKAAETKIEDL